MRLLEEQVGEYLILFMYVPPSFVVLEALGIDVILVVGGRPRQGSKLSGHLGPERCRMGCDGEANEAKEYRKLEKDMDKLEDNKIGELKVSFFLFFLSFLPLFESKLRNCFVGNSSRMSRSPAETCRRSQYLAEGDADRYPRAWFLPPLLGWREN